VADDILIRAAHAGDAQAIARVHVASWDAFYRDILPAAEFDKRPLSVREAQWAQSLSDPQRRTLVGIDTDGMVKGFASAVLLDGSEGFDSYLQTLYLLREFAGQRHGRALLIAMANELLAAGKRNMVLRTLRLNPARQFYERLGARFLSEDTPIDAGHFDDVAYAFDDLSRLAQLH
jgi:GNAT superfamily N-acetyltransferase